MDKKIINEILTTIYGLTSDEFEEKKGFLMNIRSSYSGYHLWINNVDNFYTSYTSASTVFVPTSDKLEDEEIVKLFTDKEVVKKIKQRIATKTRLRGRMEEIRLVGLENIKKFISTSFDIDLDIIQNEDICFLEYSRVQVGDAYFSFEGTLTDKSCNVITYSYKTYESFINVLKQVHKYFEGRQDGLYIPKSIANDK